MLQKDWEIHRKSNTPGLPEFVVKNQHVCVCVCESSFLETAYPDNIYIYLCVCVQKKKQHLCVFLLWGAGGWGWRRIVGEDVVVVLGVSGSKWQVHRSWRCPRADRRAQRSLRRLITRQNASDVLKRENEELHGSASFSEHTCYVCHCVLQTQSKGSRTVSSF